MFEVLRKIFVSKIDFDTDYGDLTFDHLLLMPFYVEICWMSVNVWMFGRIVLLTRKFRPRWWSTR
jgi:hypothetical protein